MRMLICSVVLIFALSDSVCVMADDTECSLRPTLDAHLAAIQAHDLRALLATVTSGNELTLIFPDGEKLDSRQQYVDFRIGMH